MRSLVRIQPSRRKVYMMEKIDFGVTYGYTEFIDKQTQAYLLNWVEENKQFLKQVDGNKITGVLEKIETSPRDLIEEFRKKILEIENLQNVVDPEKSKTFLSVYGKGSECVLHTDGTVDPNLVHVRYNLMLSKADKGGKTFYDKKFLDIDERVLWRCVAEYSKHGTETVLSNKPRIIISMGFLIGIEEYNKCLLSSAVEHLAVNERVQGSKP